MRSRAVVPRPVPNQHSPAAAPFRVTDRPAGWVLLFFIFTRISCAAMHCFLMADARPSETPIRRIVRSSNSVMQVAMRIDSDFSSFFFFPPFFFGKPLIELFTASLRIRRHSRRRSREKVDCSPIRLNGAWDSLVQETGALTLQHAPTRLALTRDPCSAHACCQSRI